jgi:hypothetical protein
MGKKVLTVATGPMQFITLSFSHTSNFKHVFIHHHLEVDHRPFAKLLNCGACPKKRRERAV